MRSQVLIERVGAADHGPVRELLVLWQHPVSRRIFPIGRLAHRRGRYTFDYTVAAAGIDDFRPLPGLGAIGQHFESESLPTLFLQRVMDRERPDFAEYVASLGLGPETATPWEQIVESGGERAGDTLQFMQVPTIIDGHAHARFLANGTQYIPRQQRVANGLSFSVDAAEIERALTALSPDDLVEIVAEDRNDTDPDAVLVTSQGIPIGWAPRFLAPSIRNLLAHDRVFARVVRVNGPGTPSQLRLVLEVHAPAPDGFSFDPTGAWEPIGA